MTSDSTDYFELGTDRPRPYRAELRAYEVNHGRAAMVGVIAAFYAEQKTDLEKVTDQWANAPSSFLAFFKGLGLLPPYYY